MCGICGIATPRRLNRRVEESLVTRMRDTLVHRGPDDAGLYVSDGIGLGHRRLSIVDLGGGHQPMSNEDGTVWTIFNGEIYNHASLRPGLAARGHQYRTTSDTETILHLYEEMGPRCVENLGGMFAFAIWDSERRQLVLARDRLGIKPLYYVLASDGTLYFASEIKALLAARAIVPEINFRALPDHLANYAASGEETLFREVRRLEPGHILVWQDGQVRTERYWEVSFRRDRETASGRDGDLVAQWSELFREAVRSHLMSDVPLGLFLSGGIDSSAIAAVMSELVDQPIQTFSVAFAEREANELEYARMVARAFRTDHHEVMVTPEDYFAAMPSLIWHEDEPLAHVASIPLNFVAQLAARRVKVVLTGEGSDEMLGGYSRYLWTVCNLSLSARYHRWTTGALRRAVHGAIESLPAGSTVRRRLARCFLCLPPDLDGMYYDNFAVFPRAMLQELLTPETQARAGGIDPYAFQHRIAEQAEAETLLDRLLYVDVKTYLHELLMKQDQMSMAASIESRVPFLDHRLVEFTARLPDHLKVRGRTTKYVLRRSMEGRLPDPILKRTKMGFPVPVGRWFRGAFRYLVDDYVLSERTLRRGLFRRRFVQDLVAEHQAGACDHSLRLWALVNFEMWLRLFFDGENAFQPEPELAEVAAARP